MTPVTYFTVPLKLISGDETPLGLVILADSVVGCRQQLVAMLDTLVVHTLQPSAYQQRRAPEDTLSFIKIFTGRILSAKEYRVFLKWANTQVELKDSKGAAYTAEYLEAMGETRTPKLHFIVAKTASGDLEGATVLPMSVPTDHTKMSAMLGELGFSETSVFACAPIPQKFVATIESMDVIGKVISPEKLVDILKSLAVQLRA
jgi:hypothetical protein